MSVTTDNKMKAKGIEKIAFGFGMLANQMFLDSGNIYGGFSAGYGFPWLDVVLDIPFPKNF